MTQGRLAAEAWISRGYLVRMETGRHDPTISVVMRLAHVLKVSMADRRRKGAWRGGL